MGGLRKEPDALLHTPSQPFPTLVAEVGWSESYDGLLDDMNWLLVGGNGAIKIVIFVRWMKHANNSVSGVLELYRNVDKGSQDARRLKSFFPCPLVTRLGHLTFNVATCTLSSCFHKLLSTTTDHQRSVVHQLQPSTSHFFYYDQTSAPVWGHCSVVEVSSQSRRGFSSADYPLTLSRSDQSCEGGIHACLADQFVSVSFWLGIMSLNPDKIRIIEQT